MAVVKVLGCGDSLGCPILGCGCKICQSSEPKNRRTRPSVAVINGESWFTIDCSPDLKAQTFGFDFEKFKGVLFTHPHADHIVGLEELRGPAYVHKRKFKIYGSRQTLLDIYSRFSYRVSYLKKLNAQRPWDEIEAEEINHYQEFEIAGIKVKPVLLYHGEMPVTGYVIGNFAYCIDANKIPAETTSQLQGIDMLLLGALWSEELGPKIHDKHFTIEQAVEVAKSLNVGRLYLSHLSHLVDYDLEARKLPPWVSLCFDGLEIHCT